MDAFLDPGREPATSRSPALLACELRLTVSVATRPARMRAQRSAAAGGFVWAVAVDAPDERQATNKARGQPGPDQAKVSPKHRANTFLDGAVAEGPVVPHPLVARVSAKTEGDDSIFPTRHRPNIFPLQERRERTPQYSSLPPLYIRPANSRASLESPDCAQDVKLESTPRHEERQKRTIKRLGRIWVRSELFCPTRLPNSGSIGGIGSSSPSLNRPRLDGATVFGRERSASTTVFQIHRRQTEADFRRFPGLFCLGSGVHHVAAHIGGQLSGAETFSPTTSPVQAAPPTKNWRK